MSKELSAAERSQKETSDRLVVLLEAAQQLRMAAVDFHTALGEWQSSDPDACTGTDGKMALLRWLADAQQFKRIAEVEFIIGGETARQSGLVAATGKRAIGAMVATSDEMVSRGVRGHARAALGCRCDGCEPCKIRLAAATPQDAEDTLYHMMRGMHSAPSPLVGPSGQPIQRKMALVRPDGDPFKRSN